MMKYTLVISGAIVFMAITLAYPVAAGDPGPSAWILQAERLVGPPGKQHGPPPDAPPRRPDCPPNVKC